MSFWNFSLRFHASQEYIYIFSSYKKCKCFSFETSRVMWRNKSIVKWSRSGTNEWMSRSHVPTLVCQQQVAHHRRALTQFHFDCHFVRGFAKDNFSDVRISMKIRQEWWIKIPKIVWVLAFVIAQFGSISKSSIIFIFTRRAVDRANFACSLWLSFIRPSSGCQQALNQIFFSRSASHLSCDVRWELLR